MEKQASILIVDDNINLTKTMALILAHKGYDVVTAKDGIEAIEIIKKKSLDLIFMDIKMPHLNGVETYKRLKKLKPEVVVMMMTAYAVDDLVHEALREGAYGIIYKPFDFSKVSTIIKECT